MEFNKSWKEIDAGGHCMIFLKEFICKDGSIKTISLNDEVINLNNVRLNDIDFEMEVVEVSIYCTETDGKVSIDKTQLQNALIPYLSEAEIEDIADAYSTFCKKYTF